MKQKFSLRFWIWHGWLPFLLFTVWAGLFATTDWDLRLSDPFYDHFAQTWPYKHSWWAEGLIHTGGKDLILVIGISALLAVIGSYAVQALRPWRRAALFLSLNIALSTGLVAVAKETTNRHCPWDHTRYDGPVPYSRLFEPPPAECKPGKCFPAGHAAGGFSLMGLYFVFYRRRPLALAGLAIGLGLGTLFSFGQVARGAHFVSHNLWTAAICWAVALLLYVFPFQGRLEPARTTADHRIDV